MTSCWAVMYAVPRGTLKIVVVSVNEDGSCWEEGFFWIVLWVLMNRRKAVLVCVLVLVSSIIGASNYKL